MSQSLPLTDGCHGWRIFQVISELKHDLYDYFDSMALDIVKIIFLSLDSNLLCHDVLFKNFLFCISVP